MTCICFCIELTFSGSSFLLGTRAIGKAPGVPWWCHRPAAQRWSRLPSSLPAFSTLTVASTCFSSQPLRQLDEQLQTVSGGLRQSWCWPEARREGAGGRWQKSLAGGCSLSRQSALRGTQWDSAARSTAFCWITRGRTLQAAGKTSKLYVISQHLYREAYVEIF